MGTAGDSPRSSFRSPSRSSVNSSPTNSGTTNTMTDHPAVLLEDDTWTTGGRAQSAAIALHDAGTAQVAVVVLGRHFDRSFGSGETYYQQAKARKFTWDNCCLEIEATAGTNSAT
jgi:hypothetical protein